MKDSMQMRAGNFVATCLFLITAISIFFYIYWASGGRWGFEVAFGKGAPLPSWQVFGRPMFLLISGAYFVLGASRGWGSSLPFGAAIVWFNRLGTWSTAALFAYLALAYLSTASHLRYGLGEGFILAVFCAMLAYFAWVAARPRSEHQSRSDRL